MSKPKLCLDFDSTLAATCDTAFELLCGPDHDYSYDDIESWAWGLEKFGKYRYLSSLWHAWTLRPTEVPPMEENPARAVERLAEEYEIHVVTAHPDHPGIDQGKKEWLDLHDIPFDEYRSIDPSISKSTLDYQRYVDDKTSLPEEVAADNPDATAYVIDLPYNRGIEAPHVRVDSIAEVADAEGL